MSLKSDEKPDLTTKGLISTLAIAGCINAQNLKELQSLPKTLDDGRVIHYSFAVVDSLSSSYSMFKYYFDLFIATNDNDLMHEMMMTPGGIIAIVSEAIFLVGFSFLACHFEYEKADREKAKKKSTWITGIMDFIAAAWPYFRDVIKGLKNAYKGLRSTLQATILLSGVDLKFLIMPLGLILGVFACGIRLWYRSIREARKTMMSDNKKLLTEFKKLQKLNKKDREVLEGKIQSSTQEQLEIAYVPVVLGALIDSLYLYLGVLTLAALSPPLLIVVAVMCVIYTLACVITRIYEEYEFQLRLEITKQSCKLVLARKELETTYSQLLSLIDKLDKKNEDIEEICRLKKEVGQLINEFELTREELQHQLTRTYFTAFLSGLRNGLYAYSAVSSVLFLVAAILALSSTAFPPALVLVGVSFGLVLMMGFITYALISHHQYLKERGKTSASSSFEDLLEMKKTIATDEEKAKLLKEEELQKSLEDSILTLDSSPQTYFQEMFEVIRCFFSGLSKGQKFVDFAGNAHQVIDEHGHYQDTPAMLVVGAIGALVFAIILSLRALAKGFGNPPKPAVEALLSGAGQDQVATQEGERQQTEDLRESVKNKKDLTDSRQEVEDQKSNSQRFFTEKKEDSKSQQSTLKISQSYDSFFVKSTKKQSLSRSTSMYDIETISTSLTSPGIIRGLE